MSVFGKLKSKPGSVKAIKKIDMKKPVRVITKEHSEYPLFFTPMGSKRAEPDIKKILHQLERFQKETEQYRLIKIKSNKIYPKPEETVVETGTAVKCYLWFIKHTPYEQFEDCLRNYRLEVLPRIQSLMEGV